MKFKKKKKLKTVILASFLVKPSSDRLKKWIKKFVLGTVSTQLRLELSQKNSKRIVKKFKKTQKMLFWLHF